VDDHARHRQHRDPPPWLGAHVVLGFGTALLAALVNVRSRHPDRRWSRRARTAGSTRSRRSPSRRVPVAALVALLLTHLVVVVAVPVAADAASESAPAEPRVTVS
jgi:hypothetical protein